MTGVTVLGEPGFGQISRGERRYKLNRLIEARYRRNGVLMYSDLDVEEAIAVLTGQPAPVDFYAPTDEEAISNARWNEVSMLTDYLNVRSVPYQRDLNLYGVYVLIEIIDGKEVPLLVEAIPRYVGRSNLLSSRLRQHASGVTIPAERVTREYLEKVNHDERARYAVMDRPEKRAFQRECMIKRQLWVQTSHCHNQKEAAALEDAMTRHYEGLGYNLWNIQKKPWKTPR